VGFKSAVTRVRDNVAEPSYVPNEAALNIFPRSVAPVGQGRDQALIAAALRASRRMPKSDNISTGCMVGLLVGKRALAHKSSKLSTNKRRGCPNGDPIAERRQARRTVPTFKAAAIAVHDYLKPSFRNEKHQAQWINTLDTYIFPVFGDRRVNQVESSDVLKALSPIWLTKPETARRVRQRTKAVFDWAKASGYRTGDNPVEGIAAVLPKQREAVKHHEALQFSEVAKFIEALHQTDAGTSTKLAFELTRSNTQTTPLRKSPTS
jgi:hypothetical protein